jgi:hypothetical protein
MTEKDSFTPNRPGWPARKRGDRVPMPVCSQCGRKETVGGDGLCLNCAVPPGALPTT